MLNKIKDSEYYSTIDHLRIVRIAFIHLECLEYKIHVGWPVIEACLHVVSAVFLIGIHTQIYHMGAGIPDADKENKKFWRYFNTGYVLK